jgi:hypothetical protein
VRKEDESIVDIGETGARPSLSEDLTVALPNRRCRAGIDAGPRAGMTSCGTPRSQVTVSDAPGAYDASGQEGSLISTGSCWRSPNRPLWLLITLHLGDLRVDILKIDRAFVSGPSSGSRSAPMLEGILGLGDGLSLLVIARARGVRTVRTPRALGCSMGQDFSPGQTSPCSRCRSHVGRRRPPSRCPTGDLREIVAPTLWRP